MTRTKKTPFLWLTLIFILPFLMSGYFYFFYDHSKFKTTNHGKFIDPVINIRQLAGIEKRWNIVYVPKHCCDATCQKNMFTLHQLRKVLNKDSSRLNLVLGSAELCAGVDIHDFKLARSSFFNTTNQFYLVDPLGNLFMSYSADENAMNILKDLKHLLEVSQIG